MLCSRLNHKKMEKKKEKANNTTSERGAYTPNMENNNIIITIPWYYFHIVYIIYKYVADARSIFIPSMLCWELYKLRIILCFFYLNIINIILERKLAIEARTA